MNGVIDGIEHVHDLVIAGGRLVDPGNQIDATRHLGVTDGLVAAISERPLPGHEVIDAPVIRDGEFGDARPGLRQLASGAE